MTATTELFYETVGEGPTMLVMHGGLGLDHTYLRPAHDVLARDVKLVYYDHRANGRSPRGNVESVDHAIWQSDAAALLDQLGEERAIIYGHSYGAWIALGFALRYPERVRALVLCGAAPAFDYMPELEANLAKADPALVAKFVHATSTPPADDAEFGASWLEILPLYFHRYTPAYEELFSHTRYSATGYLLGAACMASYNLVPRLGALATRTLVLQGEHDFITPPSQGRRIADAGASMVTFDASGHFPFAEERDRYISVLRDWLRA